MEFKFFTDLIDAVGKVATGLKALVQLPMSERKTIRGTHDETHRLIDTTLKMVTITGRTGVEAKVVGVRSCAEG